MDTADRGTTTRYVCKTVDSPVGRLTLVATDRGLAGILWENDRPRRVRLNVDAEEHGHPVLVETERQLGEYFAGRRREFTVTLDVAGYGLSTPGVERLADDPLRGDAILRPDRAADREARRGARGRRRQRP